MRCFSKATTNTEEIGHLLAKSLSQPELVNKCEAMPKSFSKRAPQKMRPRMNPKMIRNKNIYVLKI
jgi:hypothetical protein